MSPVEALESRTLFAASVSDTLLTNLSNLTSDITAARNTYEQYAPTLRADLQTLRTDVRDAGTPGGGLLVARLNAASLRFFNATRAGAVSLFAREGVAARVGLADALVLSIHPNSTRFQAKAATDLARYTASTAALVSKVGAIGATLSDASAAALDAVTAAYAGNTAVTNDIAKLQSDGSAFLSALGPSLQAAQTDLIQFLNDVAAGK